MFEASIVEAVEPEVRFLDSVKQVISFSVEGAATVLVEFEAGADMQAALSDVDAALGRVTTFPEDSESPVIQRVVLYDTIARLVLSGPVTEAALKALAKHVRDALLAAGIDQVSMFGARDEEVWVEIAPAILRHHDLTLAEISARIAASSQDLPSGTLEGDFEKQVRSVGLAVDANAIGAIEIRALDNGQKIYLRDIARIEDRFDEGRKDRVARRRAGGRAAHKACPGRRFAGARRHRREDRGRDRADPAQERTGSSSTTLRPGSSAPASTSCCATARAAWRWCC